MLRLARLQDDYTDADGFTDFAAMLDDVLPVPGCEDCNGSGKVRGVAPYGEGWVDTDPVDCECLTEQYETIWAAEAEAEQEAAAGWET